MNIGYHHVLEKHFGTAKMAVHHVIGTVEERPIQAVYSIKSTMEAGTEIAQMPHPTEQRRYVDITCAESKDREHYSQYRTKKDGKLIESNQSKMLRLVYVSRLLCIMPILTFVGSVAPTKNPHAWALSVAMIASSMK